MDWSRWKRAGKRISYLGKRFPWLLSQHCSIQITVPAALGRALLQTELRLQRGVSPHPTSQQHREKGAPQPTHTASTLPSFSPAMQPGAVGISEPEASGGEPNGWQGRESPGMRKCYTATNNYCGYIEMPFSLRLALTKQTTHAQITMVLRAAQHKAMHKMPSCLLSKICEWFSNCQANQECWD